MISSNTGDLCPAAGVFYKHLLWYSGQVEAFLQLWYDRMAIMQIILPLGSAPVHVIPT